MRTFVTVSTLAVALALGTTAATAQPNNGWDSYLHLEGVAGPSQGPGFIGWFDVTNHDIVVADEAPECTVFVDVLLRSRTPELADSVGLEIPEMEIALTNWPGQVYYRATLSDVRIKKVVTSSDAESKHSERLELSPSQIVLQVSDIKANGQLYPPRTRTLDCGGGGGR
jgi:type VI protein secretion system component Hcp